MTEFKPESAVLETETVVEAVREEQTAKPNQGFFPEVEGKKYRAGDVITVLVEASCDFSDSIDDVIFGGATVDNEAFLFEDGSLQKMVNVNRFVEFGPSLIETFTYTNEEGDTKQGRTTTNQPLFYCKVEVTGYDVSGKYAMMRVKPVLPSIPKPNEMKKPVEFSQKKNDLVKMLNLAVFSQDDNGLGELIKDVSIFKSELAIYDALHKAGKISKKLGRVSLMAKELSFASLKEAVNTISMAGTLENYRPATMDDFDAIYEMVKSHLPYFSRLKQEDKENVAGNVRRSIAKHDVRVLPINGKVAFFASYNTELGEVACFGYRKLPGVNETLVATWALRRCLSSFSTKYGIDTFYIDAGADNTQFGKSNVIDILEKRLGINAYKIIGKHRFYSIAILSKNSKESTPSKNE